MKIKTEIEIPDDYLTVTFEGFPEWEDLSCDTDRGLYAIAPFAICQDITWNKKDFTPTENKAIDHYMEKCSASIEQLLCEEYENQHTQI